MDALSSLQQTDKLAQGFPTDFFLDHFCIFSGDTIATKVNADDNVELAERIFDILQLPDSLTRSSIEKAQLLRVNLSSHFCSLLPHIAKRSGTHQGRPPYATRCILYFGVKPDSESKNYRLFLFSDSLIQDRLVALFP